MPKPPASPPNSDIDGVHQDETRAGKPLPAGGKGGADLARAARLNAARPDPSEEISTDDRTG